MKPNKSLRAASRVGYSSNYLIDTDNAIILDVQASGSVRTGETHAT